MRKVKIKREGWISCLYYITKNGGKRIFFLSHLMQFKKKEELKEIIATLIPCYISLSKSSLIHISRYFLKNLIHISMDILCGSYPFSDQTFFCFYHNNHTPPPFLYIAQLAHEPKISYNHSLKISRHPPSPNSSFILPPAVSLFTKK